MWRIGGKCLWSRPAEYVIVHSELDGESTGRSVYGDLLWHQSIVGGCNSLAVVLKALHTANSTATKLSLESF